MTERPGAVARDYTPFHAGYVWAALGLALFPGFALGAHLASVLGFGFPIREGFVSFVQTHGHVQLVGWAGLFILGISLHFIPRLAGAPLGRPQWIPRILAAVAGGLMLRSIAHPMLPYASGWARGLLGILVAASALSEAVGIAASVLLVVETMHRARRAGERPALHIVQPFFGTMTAGWAIYAGLDLLLAIRMAASGSTVLDPAWNRFAIAVFISLVLLPVAFGFSVRLLPLYLRLPKPDWPVRATAQAYLAAVALELGPPLASLVKAGNYLPSVWSSLGQAFKGVVVLWFVWNLGLRNRRRLPWTVQRTLDPGPDRRPTGEGLPDYDEFGRFERLIYSAYLWLVTGAVLDAGSGVSFMAGHGGAISGDAVRHLYLLGFVTHLILGMSVRMIPGFVQKRRVASPALVDATFWLGNAALVCRVMPLLLPAWMVLAVPGLADTLGATFGVSGILGMFAVGCLAVNLWKTIRQPDTPPRNPSSH
ncbi:MAG: hypothetical protein KatS3mg015_3040 [Fimbriimonadales bacterium]|nr:MAG: hypothetical protein KatS3mg015_3040 [Fimbriimonadales bacterium]